MAVGLLVAVGCGASNAAKPCTCNTATSVASATGGGSAGAAPSTCVAGTAPGVRVGLQRATATFSQSYTGQFSVDKIIDGEIALIFNTTEGWQSHKDSQSIRASALEKKVPYYTTAAASIAAAQAIVSVRVSELEVRSLQDYYS